MNKPILKSTAGLVLALVHQFCAAQLVMCGMGPPPGSPDFDGWNAKIEQQRQELGYLLVCDEQLERYRYEAQVASDKAVIPKLSFTPRALDGSGFSKLEFLGSIADGFGDRGASMYRRVFRGAEGEVLTLQEFSQNGGERVRWWRKDGILKVAGIDAQLTVLQVTPVNGVSMLAWQDGPVYYEVTVNRGADNERSKQRLIALAESLPRKSK